MRLIASGLFDLDGTILSANEVSSIVKPDPAVPAFDIHFSTTTRREGTQEYHWFSQQNGGFGVPIIEWYSPNHSKITLNPLERGTRAVYVQLASTYRVDGRLIMVGGEGRPRAVGVRSGVSEDDGNTWACYDALVSTNYLHLQSGGDANTVVSVLRDQSNGHTAFIKSTDGIVWSEPVEVTATAVDPLDCIVVGDTIVVIGAAPGLYLAYASISINGGATWNTVELPGPNAPGPGVLQWNPYSVTYVGGRIMIVGGNSNGQFCSCISDDLGANWTYRQTATTMIIKGVAGKSATDFVVVGYDGNQNNGMTAHTTDGGATWAFAGHAYNENFDAVCVHGTEYIAAGGNSQPGTTGVIGRSADGVAWTYDYTSIPDSAIVNHLTSADGQLILSISISGTWGSGVALSDDGITWDDQYKSNWGLAVIREYPDGEDELEVPVKFSADPTGSFADADAANHPWTRFVSEARKGVASIRPVDYANTLDASSYYCFEVTTNIDIKPDDLFFIYVGGDAQQTAVYTVLSARVFRISFLTRAGLPQQPTGSWHVALVRA